MRCLPNGADETRTRHIQIANLTLYQMSYGPGLEALKPIFTNVAIPWKMRKGRKTGPSIWRTSVSEGCCRHLEQLVSIGLSGLHACHGELDLAELGLLRVDE